VNPHRRHGDGSMVSVGFEGVVAFNKFCGGVLPLLWFVPFLFILVVKKW